MTSEDLTAIVAAVVAAIKASQSAPPQVSAFNGITIGALLQEYLASADYRGLAEASKPPYRRVLERWIRQYTLGALPIASLTRQDVERHLAAESPGAGGFLLKRLRVLTKFALVRCYIAADPCAGIKTPSAGGTWHTWTDDEIAKYRAHWKLGTRERLAFELALNCAARRTDIARAQWEQIKGGAIRMRQSKTGRELVLPVALDLQAAIDAWRGPRTGHIIRHPRRRKGLSPESLGNLFAEWIDAAGLPSRCVLHGIRKGRCRQLAEAGASEKEISSVSGHLTLGMVQHYTKAADQERLARAALARLRTGGAA